ncbi:pyridoxal phosphate-dependent aminotransferase [Kushneria indalinina]|uniref:Aminotransferase n=1 Tax=Kushneria indalinina DSM 14324 TaxID=1122140 RepID=A0A3D9DTU0_9GAMM|nr:pyridoxal phosphate-dependent aminotransferase [Kushneria indalinina]REC93829.1 aspartate aminotransferase [Kushneria indalinina DSM 14324]
MTTLARRLSTIAPSATIEISRRAADMRRQGLDIISLSQGEPDFDTPAHIAQAGKRAIDDGQTRYTDVDGTPELKQAVAAKFERDNGLHYATDQISVGTGGKQVIFNALFALIDPEDEVIIPAPYWVSYPDMVRLAGGMPVCVECDGTQGFKLTPEQLETAITPQTKCLILNSPGNPTGAGYHREELIALGEVLKRHPQVFVISDDIYEYLAYDDWAFTTLAAVVPELFERTLTVNGVSKGYAMTGWRIGFGGGPKDLIRAMAMLQGQMTTNPSAISQAAAVEALNGSREFLEEHLEIFRQRRDMCTAAFNAIDGLSCRAPEGAFYLFISCQGLIGRKTPEGEVLERDVDVARFLLDAAHVAVVPGTAFGLGPWFRISFAAATERLGEACERIAHACETLTDASMTERP